MSKPKEIRELEKIYGITLKELSKDKDILSLENSCYQLGSNNEIIGLNLSDNEITEIKGLEQLTQLQKLYLSCNKITEIKGLEQLTQLQKLNLYHNNITEIKGLEQLTQLQELDLSHNQITEIKGLEQLTQLQELDLSCNKITEIKGLEQLTQLQKLDLFINQITEIKGLEQLTQLQKLDLANNRITEIKGLEQLTQLQELDLADNQITEIKGLEQLTQLQELYLYGNQITEIKGLEQLTQLDAINLRNNPITNLQPLLNFDLCFIFNVENSRLPMLENGITITGCDQITNPPLEIAKQGDKAIRRYFSRIEKEGEDYIYEAKLILVGQGNSGKTSLQKRLLNEKSQLPKKEKHTRGIEVVDFEFDTGQMAHIWDFGGQVVYYPVHRFFITKNAVFVLLASTREHNHNFDYWIPTIYQFGGQSPIIIGQTCHDGLTIPWNDLGVYLSNSNFNIIKITPKVYHEIDLTHKNRGLNEIRKCIVERIKELSHFGRGVPKSWSTVRNALLEKSKSNPCISFESFANLCKELEPVYLNKEEDIKDCCQFFHDIGVVLWYSDIEELKDWVVLQPKWAMNAVYKIIDDKEISINNGLVHKSDFERLWIERSYRGKHEILKKMLVRFKIAFPAKQSQNQTYILPAQLESIPVEKRWDLKEESLRLEYQFEFMPKGIVNQLSAELSNHINSDGKDIWNNAVNFIREHNESQVIEDSHNRKLSITSKGIDARSNNTIIMNALNNIIREYQGVTAEIHVPCTCNKCRTSEKPMTFLYDDLISWSNEGETTVRCNKGREDLSIFNLLYNAGFETRPLKRTYFKEIQFEQKNEKPSTETITIFLASSEELKEDREQFEIFINRENKEYHKEGIFLELRLWEDFIDRMSQTRLQDEYNEAAINSDIFVSLFWTKVGKYTKEEFSKAYTHFKEKRKPSVYTYFKNELIHPKTLKQDGINSLLDFKEELSRLGHYPTEYQNIADLQLQFKTQLQKILPDLIAQRRKFKTSKDLYVEEGYVL